MKRSARRVNMKDCRVGCVRRQFDGLQQWQRRWCCGQPRTGQRRDHADGAKFVRVLTRIRRGRRQLLLGRLDRRRCLRRDGVEVAKRKGKLDGERKQRQPCTSSDVSPHPLHGDDTPLVPTFRSSYTVSAPSFHQLLKVMGTSKSMILVPLCYLKFLDRIRRLRCRNFKLTVLAGSPSQLRRYNVTSQVLRFCVNCRKTIRNGVGDQRPSRSQVAAKAPSSNNRPIRPAKTGKTPTPRTTLASRIFTPIQPSPRKMLDA